MDTALDLLHALTLPFVIVGGLVSLFLWWKSGFWVPRYIHVIAGLSSLLGLLLSWMARDLDHPLKERHVWIAVIFPALVYVVFGFYGGRVIEQHLLEKQHEKDRAP
ncbi:MAG TPA: hypothetical protein VGV13_06050 [Methylomirabilota bacterium]|jgi:hypothetical protein|nr:hypothetical protein [Methylomirabilota bacterium]